MQMSRYIPRGLESVDLGWGSGVNHGDLDVSSLTDDNLQKINHRIIENVLFHDIEIYRKLLK